MTIEDFLFGLIRTALWNDKMQGVEGVEMDHNQYETLKALAKEQTVYGLMIRGLAKNGIRLGKMDAINLCSIERKLAETNASLNREAVDLTRIARDGNRQLVIVKGQSVAALYPEPDYRVPGDIDAYGSLKDFDALTDAIGKEWGVNIHDTGYKHVDFIHNEVDFEVHRRLSVFCSMKSQKYWDALYAKSFDETDYVMIGGEKVPVLRATLNVLYVFVHLYLHLLVLGIAARQFCDVAVLLHHYKDVIDRDALEKHLRGIDFYDAFCAVGCVLVDKIGLKEDEFPFKIEEWHRRYSERILSDVFKRGNFGHYNRKQKDAGWMHSIETGFISINHCLRYYRLSPREIRMFLPRQIMISVKANLKKE